MSKIVSGKPTVILIGADKGGVGKTTVTRTLLDYLAARGIAHRAFDTETPKGTLKRFHPDITDVVDVTQARDQMKIFDTINASKVTAIDVRAGLLSEMLTTLSDIGFLDGVRNGEFNLALFHILGPSIASLDEIAQMSDYLTGAHHFLVKNVIGGTTFFEWDPATYDKYFNRMNGAAEIVVPQLNPIACETVELAGARFADFVANKAPDGTEANYSFVLRGHVRHWLNGVWAEYDRVGIADLARPAEAPSKEGSDKQPTSASGMQKPPIGKSRTAPKATPQDSKRPRGKGSK